MPLARVSPPTTSPFNCEHLKGFAYRAVRRQQHKRACNTLSAWDPTGDKLPEDLAQPNTARVHTPIEFQAGIVAD